ncbi:hypothetical protein RHMOL_Rhmol06G0251000 [Rhododendron molle]|uniref:Uncharacterized protein n=1 Tax=Rhododendron molle TaxID=49168 RepID=A0ACC0NI18_RHOML|nr:hypothetical protein RHMOL_Rhmol06G0251000 [Rhododendron molle]
MSLCHLLKQNGLEESRNVTLVERVAIFLWILYTIQKIGVRPFNFGDQGKQLVDISTLFCWWCYAFTMCCGIIQKLFLLMSQMLDGTFVPVLPPTELKARFRSRKGDYATNVLGVCSRNLQFIYALSGWEGSATDSRVLRNALVRPNGLKIPQGMSLCNLSISQHTSTFV